MARLVFLPNDTDITLLESPLPSAAMIQAINQGEWQPPAPYSARTSDGRPVFRAVQMGSFVVVARDLPEALREPGSTPEGANNPQRGVPIHLSIRQHQVLKGVGEGLGDKEIAARLNLSINTVRQHILIIKGKLGSHTRTDLVRQAITLGLIKMKRK